MSHSSPPSRQVLAALDEPIRAHLGDQLRLMYGDPTRDRLPRSLRGLADRVFQVFRARTEPVDQAFIDKVMATLPALRAFGISLTKNLDKAEDLVQDTIVKAISKRDHFENGTNLQAWLFTILRNNHFTALRASHREVEDADGKYAEGMIAIPEQEGHLMMTKLREALTRLPREQRQALLMVSLEGKDYEAAALELNCSIGTIKSRVNRARGRLAEMLQMDQRKRAETVR